MSSKQEIEEQLRDAGIPISGTAIRSAEGDNFYYVFVEVHRDARGRLVPSNAKLMATKAYFQEKGYLIDFLLKDATVRDAEVGLRATLLYSFGELLRNSFLAFQANEAFVWVDPKRQLTEHELNEVGRKAKVFLDDVGLKLSQITTTWGENLPSKTICISVLRQAAPATTEELVGLLRGAEFIVPSKNWMTRRLDALRKAGLVVRMRSGRYTLTLQALKGLGTVKGRRSPDISRLLALAGKHG